VVGFFVVIWNNFLKDLGFGCLLVARDAR